MITPTPTPDEICERDASGETVLGMRVAAYRETHPEHGNKFGHIYSEHWSTPNYQHPNVKVERLFTEKQVRDLIQQQLATIERLSAEKAELLNDIAVMMSEFVDNWPQPKKVSTALALIAKTLRAALGKDASDE